MKLQLLNYLFLMTLIACSKISSTSIKDEAINGQYSAVYSEDAGKASFTASFFAGTGIGASYIQLSGENQILLNNEALASKENVLNQVVYQKEMEGSYEKISNGSYKFEFKDKEGKSHVYNANILAPIFVSITQPQTSNGIMYADWQVKEDINPTDRIEFTWKAKQNEKSIGVGVETYFLEKNKNGSIKFDLYSRHVTFDSSADVEVSFGICRARYLSQTSDGVGVSWVTEKYCTKNQTVIFRH